MTIIAGILLFGFIVFIHELGHFLFAKKAGINIYEFSIGMGPKIISKQKDETMYSIRAFPIGGYVSMEGEDEKVSTQNSFGEKTLLQRASVIAAGPIFNIILTILLLIPVFFSMGVPTNENIVGTVQQGSPAIESGLTDNDKILSIDGEEVNSWEEIVSILSTKSSEINLLVDRNGEEIEISVTPKEEDGRYIIGIVPYYEKSISNSVFSAFTTTFDMIKEMLSFLLQLVTGSLPEDQKDAVAGPIGVIGIVSDAASMGITQLVYVGAVISLNLGVMNLLPIPALDGGRLLFLLFEAITGKKLDPDKEIMINNVGFMMLMAFMLFVTFKDVGRLF